jgi:FlaA1/EpsC-like NDP-sugar epimerase
MIKPKIILIGAGGHCRSCIDVIEQQDRFEILGIVDKAGQDEPSGVLGYPLIGTVATWSIPSGMMRLF